MACTEGKTNKECSYLGVGWWIGWVGREQKVGSAEKNCGYGLPDSIMCGNAGRLGHVMCGTAAKKRCAPTFNSLSDSGVQRGLHRGGGMDLSPIRCCSVFAVGVFFSAEPTFFSRSDFFSDMVRDVRGEHRESPWQVSGDIMAKTRFRLLYPFACPR